MLIALGRQFNLKLLVLLGAIAGLFHGYAYGEAIVGAEMPQLFSYLVGFTSIQLTISFGAWALGQSQIKKSQPQGLLRVRFIGFTICGAGVALLSSLLLS